MGSRTPFADRSSNNSSSDPTSTDDISAGWEVGSRWINASNQKVWFCVDSTASSAVWKDVTAAGSGSHPVTVDVADPTINSDTNSGFDIGDHWINTVTQQIFQAVGVNIGAAIWERIDQPKLQVTTADPVPGDDSADGFEVGSLWVNTTTTRAWIAVDVSVGAAVWRRITNRKINVTTVDPAVGNDNTEDYEIGSVWVNTSAAPPRNFIAVGVSTGAAEWIRQTNLKGSVSSVDPTVDDDADDDYEIGSQWYNQVTHDLFVLIDATVGAAQWWAVRSETGAHVLKGTAGFGSLLDYPAVGSLAADQIQYIAVRLFSGKIYDRMVVFIDSGGTAGRDLQLGVYDQATPSDSIVDPDSRVAQTDVVDTNTTQPGFYVVQLTDGAGTPQTYTVPDPGVYWLAVTVDSNAVKFASTNQYRADYLPKRSESGAGGLPASAGTLSNPAEALILVAMVEQGVTLPV